MEKTAKNPKGAGRKGFDREQMVKKILNSADKVVYETLNRMGRYANVEDSVIIELAARIHVKAMPQKVEGEMEHKHTAMGRVKLNGQVLEIDLG